MRFKNHFLSLLSLLFLGLAIPSCKDSGEKYKQDISQIDSLLKELEKAELGFKALDSAKVNTAFGGQSELMEQINEVVKDTLAKDQAILISDFRSIKKPLREFKLRRSGLLTEIGVTKEQLSHLSHDLKNGLIKDEEAGNYIQSEVDLAKRLIQSLNIITSIIPQQLSKYDSLQPLILDFVKHKQDSLTNKLPGT